MASLGYVSRCRMLLMDSLTRVWGCFWVLEVRAIKRDPAVEMNRCLLAPVVLVFTKFDVIVGGNDYKSALAMASPKCEELRRSMFGNARAEIVSCNDSFVCISRKGRLTPCFQHSRDYAISSKSWSQQQMRSSLLTHAISLHRRKHKGHNHEYCLWHWRGRSHREQVVTLIFKPQLSEYPHFYLWTYFLIPCDRVGRSSEWDLPSSQRSI